MHLRPGVGSTRWGLLVAVVVAITACGTPAEKPPISSSTAVSVPAATTSPTKSNANPVAPAGFSLVATGDVLLHESLWEQAATDGGGLLDFKPQLAAVKPLISSGDLALCHLETPLADAKGPFSGYPLFSGPPSIAQDLKATGFDVCSTASNHTFDQGAAGVDRTLTALDNAKIAHTGSARSAAEAARTTMITVGGAKVAFLSFTFGFNGQPYPGGDTSRANLLEKGAIDRAAGRARAAGAQVIVLSLHWGDEYSHEPSASQRALAPQLAGSPNIDVIISHHAHVVAPITKIGKTWVVFGLGNFIAWHSTPGDDNSEGLVVRFRFAPTSSGRYEVTKAEYQPIMVAREVPIRLLDVPAALATGRYGSSSWERLRQALARTIEVVESPQSRRDGLTMIGPRSVS